MYYLCNPLLLLLLLGRSGRERRGEAEREREREKRQKTIFYTNVPVVKEVRTFLCLREETCGVVVSRG